jgi:hypothetical protein
MDIARFRHNCSTASLESLLTMRANAQAKGANEFVRAAEAELNQRFPGWNRVRTRSTPTKVRFDQDEQLFDTAKEAYLWLVEKFAAARPSTFQKVDWSTQFVVEGTKRRYFARNPKGLFPAAPQRAEDASLYEKLSNGWFAITNLNNDEKFAILCRLAAVGKMEFERHWYWEIL